VLQLPGLLFNGLKVGVEALHDGTWREKCVLCRIRFVRKNGHSAIAAAFSSNPIEKSNIAKPKLKNQSRTRIERYSISTGKSARANWRYIGQAR